MKQFLRVLTLICLISVPSLVHAGVDFHISATSGCSSLSPFLIDASSPACPGATYTFNIYYHATPGSPYTLSMTSGSLTVGFYNPNLGAGGFGGAGYYTVTEVRNCSGVTDTITKVDSIQVLPLPTVRFDAANPAVDTILSCAGTKTLINTSLDTTASGNRWSWQVSGPDGTSYDTTTNLTRAFTVPGNYTITLTLITANCGSISYTRVNMIKIQAAPIACFSRVDTSYICNAPAIVCFNNCSSGAVSYSWHFGDQTTSTASAPCHTYTASGVYSDTLTAFSSAGCSATIVDSADVIVHAFSSVIRPSSAPDTVCQFTTVSFSDSPHVFPVYPAITLSYVWNVYNSAGVLVSGPSAGSLAYSFDSVGRFKIVVTTTSTAGCSAVDSHYVFVRPAPMMDSFTANNLYRCSPNDTVHFTTYAVTGAGPLSYLWHFDGNPAHTSTLPSPTYIYTLSSTSTGYSPYVVLTDVHGCQDSFSRSDYVYVTLPSVHLVADADSGCVGAAGITVSWHTEHTPLVLDSTSITTDSVWFSDHTVSCIGSGCAQSSHVFHDTGIVKIYQHWSLPDSLGGCSGVDSTSILLSNTHPDGTLNMKYHAICPHTIDSFWSNCTNCTHQTWQFQTSPGGGATFPDTSSTTVPYNYPSGSPVGPGKWPVLWIGDSHGCVDTLVDSVLVYGPNVPTSITKSSTCAHQDSIKFTSPPSPFITGITGYTWHVSSGNPLRPVDSTPGISTNNFFTDTFKNRPSGIYYDTVFLHGDATNNFCINYQVDSFPFDHVPHTFVMDTVACRGAVVNMNGPQRGNGFPYSKYVWYFGDGSPVSNITFDSTNTHIYTANGVYYDLLLIQNPFVGPSCLDTVGRRRVEIGGPSGTLTTSTAIPTCAGAGVVLTDNNTDLTVPSPYASFYITSRWWYLNNPPTTTSTVSNVPINGSGSNVYTYAFPEGVYNVAVIDTDNFGCTATDTITITAIHPHAYFYSADSNITACRGLSIPFHDTNTHCTYVWNFGDGSSLLTSSSPDVTHTYASNGTFTVKVTIIPDGTVYPVGCLDSFTRAGYIHVADVPVSMSFPRGLSATCAPFSFIANNASFSPSNTYTWTLYHAPDSLLAGGGLYHYTGTFSGSGSALDTFGTAAGTGANGVSWSQNNIFSKLYETGHYYVELTVATSYGCRDSVLDSITIGGANGSINVTPTSGCQPLLVTSTLQLAPGSTPVAGTFYWFYPGSGANSTTSSPETFTYVNSGNFAPPYLFVYDGGICTSVFHSSDSIHVYPKPSVTASHALGPICFDASETIYAHGADTYTWLPTTYLNTAVDSVVVSTPPSTITYTVTGHTVHGCIDTAITTVNVLPPVIVHILGKDSICIGTQDTLIATGLPDYHYVWDSTVGISCAVCDTALITITSTQTYTVHATNAAGCTGSDSFKVTVNPLPHMDYYPKPAYVCARDSTYMSALGAATYVWKPLLGLSCGTCERPWCSITSNIIYTVTGTSVYGCVDSEYVPVNYYDTNATGVSPVDTTICFGSSAYLRAWGGDSYLWYNNHTHNGATIDNPTAYNPTVTPDSSTVYVVTIYENPCFSKTYFSNVTVIPTPVIQPMTGSTIIAGNSVHLSAVVTNDVITNYVWTPSDTTLTCINCPSPIATPTANTTYTVTVSTAEGCHSEASVTIKLICENTQVFIPNTFTPNGDGVNDHFYISGKGLGLIKRIGVYNRWGELVYEARDIQPNDEGAGWDGTFRGVVLTPDVFIYVVDVECEAGELFSFKGDISLVR